MPLCATRHKFMIKKNDFKEKRILYISNQADFPNEIKINNCNIVLSRNGKKLNQISCYLVFCVFVIGEHTITSQLLRKLNNFGISVFLLSASFHPYASFLPCGAGNYLLRQKQYSLNHEICLGLSINLVNNKINNQEKNLLKINNYTGLNQEEMQTVYDKKSLLGMEGMASKKYFQNFFSFLKWQRRAPRTKEDIVNLLLDMGYTFLFNYIDALLLLFGFDTYRGFYHELFFQRKSLSCDLIEPIRPMIDYTIYKAYKLNQINVNDFIFENQMYRFKNSKIASKYVNIFTLEIMKNNSQIYDYVFAFYRHVMDPIKYQWKDYQLC